MSTKKKLLLGAAGAAGGGGAGLDVDDVFSTSLYEGTNAAQTITNNIDLSSEGGMLWFKNRDLAEDPMIVDTVRGGSADLYPNGTNAVDTDGSIASFNNNGFTFISGANKRQNVSGYSYVNWTFRQAPKFFDVISWNGDGTNARQISHNLDAVPHVMITRPYSTSSGWAFAHYDGSTWRYGELNTSDSMSSPPSAYVWGDRSSFIAPTSSVITVAGPQTGVSDGMNKSGVSYITYLFAHNDSGDGGFGPDGDADIIKCGSYTGNGSSTGPVIDCGFQPQFVMVKNSSATGGWQVMDSMRGIVTGGNDGRLQWNTNDAEASVGFVDLTPTGFQVTSTGSNMNTDNAPYIFMAVRRGSLFPPTDATKVFSVNETGTGDSPTNNFTVGFDPDMNINTTTAGNQKYILTRLLGTNFLKTNATSAQTNQSDASFFDSATGTLDLNTDWWSTASNVISWSWKRAPSYFDVTTWSGTGAGDIKIVHHLGVAPEMLWLKPRTSGDSYSGNWMVWHKDFGHSQSGAHLNLNNSESLSSATGVNPVHSFDSDGISPNIRGGGSGEHNKSGVDYIAYLFASSDVSKVGSYTGNGSSSGPTVDCGFSGSPRFVLIKKATGGTGSWYVFDSVRGIVAGAESQLYLNNTVGEQTATDQIDPTSSGFQIVINSGGLNTNGETYIFYAIA